MKKIIKLEEFIRKHDVDYSNKCVDEMAMPKIIENCGMKFGSQLTYYILRYGYLGYGFVEFYGVSRVDFLHSDMIKETKYLHKWFPETYNKVAFENQGDGDYYLVDENDNMYRFLSSREKSPR